MEFGNYVPGGSYQDTSQKIKVLLSAECKKKDGTTWQQSTLDITYLSNADIANMDGKLVNQATDSSQQTASGNYMPGGSYQETSQKIKVILSAECKKIDGYCQESTLDLTDLNNADLANMDGRLTNLNNVSKVPNVKGISARISLTEDFKADMTAYKVYRAIISLPMGTTEAKISAVQDLQVQIDGKDYTLNPAKPVTVPTNLLNKMVLTTAATELSIPAIKVRTDEMKEGESYIICLDSHTHHKIADMQAGTIAANREQLGIHTQYSDEQCHHIQTAITHLASAYQTTYNQVEGVNGVYHDRYVRPHNMENLHWKYSSADGVIPLKPEDVVIETVNAKLVKPAAGQFWGAITDAFKDAESIVVHTVSVAADTIEDLGENAINTVENIATDAGNTVAHIAEDDWNTIQKTGNDLVHGNVTGAVGDVISGSEAVLGDVLTGGENIVSDTIRGVENSLVITFKGAKDEVQYILDHTGKLGDAIKGFLHELEVDMEKFIVWLAEELGWDDILKIQKVIEQTFNDGMDKMPKVIENLKPQIDKLFNTIKTDLDSSIEQARAHFGANPNVIRQSNHDPATLDKSQGHTDWVMSKVTGSDSSATADSLVTDNFAVPEPPQDVKALIDDFIKTLEDKFENDQTLKKAIDHLKDDFQNLFDGSLLDAPEKMILIVLDLVEIVADAALDLVNTVVDVLLDAFAGLLKWFQQVVNTPIELPFITDLYRILTDGEQLTVLNFSSLLIAIPAKFIAEFFGDDLASMLPSSSQSLDGIQKFFGYCYAGCQFIGGIMDALLDLVPPHSLSSLAQSSGGEGKLTPEALSRYNEYRIGRLARWSNCLSYTPIVISVASQIFGNPKGDSSISTSDFYGNPNASKSDEIINVIWGYQWIMLCIDFFHTCNVNSDPKSEDVILYCQCSLEVLHLVAFCGYFVSRRFDDHNNFGELMIDFSFLVDPLEGIGRTGRTTEAIEASKGTSYLVVPVGDIGLQTVYAIFYALGINKS